MRDRGELFESDGNVVRFGEYRFSVNTQATELTIVPRDGVPHLHITGTGFFEPLPDMELWDQELVSETNDVYRGEYLAFTAGITPHPPAPPSPLSGGEKATTSSPSVAFSPPQRGEGARSADEGSSIRDAAAARYDEGYERGVHDHDAMLIAEKVRGMLSTADLLRYTPTARAAAALFWA